VQDIDLGPEFAEIKDRQCRVSFEALQHVFAIMPFGTVFLLTDGRWAKLKKFVSPRMKEDDGVERPEFGFDILIYPTKELAEDCDACSSSHIEYFARQTGWGGMPDAMVETG